MSLYEELKRRNVFRVAAAYIIVGWLVMQIGEVMAPALNLPDWVISALAFFLILGLPLALVLAWAFELTPDGIRREKDVEHESPVTSGRRRLLDVTMLVLLAVAIVFMARGWLSNDPAPEVAEPSVNDTAQQQPPEDGQVASIAVLPFLDMSPDKDQEYFSDGIAEELLNLLVRVDGLKVASRTSSFAYKSDTPNIPRIAQELNVSNILEGSVRKAGNRVRITAQLIDTAHDRHLWSETFDRDLTDIFAIQEEIANAIVNALRAELGLETVDDMVRVQAATREMPAYDLYLKAYADFINREAFAQAVLMLEEAVTIDPAFAKAWELLAAVAMVAPGWGVTDRDYEKIARNAAETAIGLSDSRSMAWAVLGTLTAYAAEPDVATGIDYLTRAIEEDPKNPSAWLWRAIQYSPLGFHQAAARDLRRCLEVDPAYLLCFYHLGLVESLLGNHQALRENTARMLQLGFDHHIDQHTLFLGAQGDHLAARLMTRLMPEHPDFPREEFLRALENPGGDHSEGLAKALRWLQQDDRVGASEMLFFSFRAWDRLVHDDGVLNHWIWSPLHPDFRQSEDFKRIVRALGLDGYWRARGFPPQCRPAGETDFECE